MCKDIQILNLFRKILHSQGALDIAFNCAIESLIEIDTGCAVDDDIASIYDQLQIFRIQAYVLFFKITLTTLI